MPELFSPDSIAKYVISLGFDLVEKTDVSITVAVRICDFSVRLRGKLDGSFPMSVPPFFLLDRTKYGRLAHVGWRREFDDAADDIGVVCNGVSISRSVNFESPEQVFEYGLQAAIGLLTECLSSTKSNDRQVLEEFAGHWLFSCGERKGSDIAMIEPEDHVMPLKVFQYGSSSRLYCMNDLPINDTYPLPSERSGKGFSHKGVYIPMDRPIFPPAPQESVLDWWRSKLLPDIPNSVLEDLKSTLRKSTLSVKKYSVIIRVPSFVEGSDSWVGFYLQNTVKGTPPLQVGADVSGWQVTPFNVQVHNQDYLLPRGGVSQDISSERLLVVGCGSVGGEIARLIGHAGVGQLDLIDFDSLESNNIYRHLLPSIYLGHQKTSALASYLKFKFPYLDVEPCKGVVSLYALAQQENLEQLLSQYDGIIVATGDATEERYFNDVLSTLDKKPWVIYSWLEGYGVGGHAVYVHKQGKGCLSCLYRDPSTGEPSLENIQNFMSVNQDVAVDISGCGTYFLPYGYSDVVETALLAVRMVFKALNQEVEESVRCSWIGSSDEAEKKGLKLRRRYYQFDKNQGIDSLLWSECPICCFGGQE